MPVISFVAAWQRAGSRRVTWLGLVGLLACAPAEPGGLDDTEGEIDTDTEGDDGTDSDTDGTPSCGPDPEPATYAEPELDDDQCDQQHGVAALAVARDGSVFVQGREFNDHTLRRFSPTAELLWERPSWSFRPVGPGVDGVLVGLSEGSVVELDEEGEEVSSVSLEVEEGEVVADIERSDDGWFAVGTRTFGPVPGVTGTWSARYDAAGGRVWAEHVDEKLNGRPIHPQRVRRSGDAGLVVAATYDEGEDRGLVRVRGLGPDGEPQWSYERDAPLNSTFGVGLSDLAIASDGSVAVVGGNANDASDGWIDLLSPSGELLWSLEGDDAVGQPNAAVFDHCDVLYVAGEPGSLGGAAAFDLLGERVPSALTPSFGFPQSVEVLDLDLGADGALWMGGEDDFGTCEYGLDVEEPQWGVWLRRAR